VLHQVRPEVPIVLMTTDRPSRGSAGRLSLDAVSGAGRPVFDTVELLDAVDRERLSAYAAGGRPPG